MTHLPDVQSWRAQHDFKLARVGVTGIKKLVQVRRPGRRDPYTMIPDIDAFVDLPGNQRGIHMSRNIEAINETIELVAREPVQSLEEFTQLVAEGLLKRHDYASIAEVELEADYFLERSLPSGVKSQECYKLLARAAAEREGSLRRAIGVEVVGMNACPCAMEATREMLSSGGKEGPSITHNQRNRTLLMIETLDGNGAGEAEADDLIELVESCLSAPTFEYLKRGDEACLVIRAHEKPRFVEDIVREVLSEVVKRYPRLPDEAVIAVRSEAEESIHKHNAYAERATTLGELRNSRA